MEGFHFSSTVRPRFAVHGSQVTTHRLLTRTAGLTIIRTPPVPLGYVG